MFNCVFGDPWGAERRVSRADIRFISYFVRDQTNGYG